METEALFKSLNDIDAFAEEEHPCKLKPHAAESPDKTCTMHKKESAEKRAFDILGIHYHYLTPNPILSYV